MKAYLTKEHGNLERILGNIQRLKKCGCSREFILGYITALTVEELEDLEEVNSHEV